MRSLDVRPSRSQAGHLLIGLLIASCMVLGDPILELSDRLLKAVARQYGSSASSRLLEWRDLMTATLGGDEQAKLIAVNAFFNRIPQKIDIEHWGRENYWATPVELLISNGGDCEDFALAKYFTLLRVGISDEKLRISYVKAYLPKQGTIQAHMVLSYYATPEAEPLILDNINQTVLPAHQRSDLVPVYGFNGSGLWKAKERGRTQNGMANEQGLWRDLLTRMQHEFDEARGKLP